MQTKKKPLKWCPTFLSRRNLRRLNVLVGHLTLDNRFCSNLTSNEYRTPFYRDECLCTTLNFRCKSEILNFVWPWPFGLRLRYWLSYDLDLLMQYRKNVYAWVPDRRRMTSKRLFIQKNITFKPNNIQTIIQITRVHRNLCNNFSLSGHKKGVGIILAIPGFRGLL